MDAQQLTEHLLVAIACITALAFLGGRLARRFGQPPVLGEITIGILLGPSVLGALAPSVADALFPMELLPSLRTVAQLGLVLFMFLVGLEFEEGNLSGQGRRAVVISQVGILVPFVLGAACGWVVYDVLDEGGEHLPFALFVGAAMAVTAFPVLARILRDTGIGRTRIGALVLACAAVDDVTAWCILAAVLAVADGSGFGDVVLTMVAAAAFGVGMVAFVRPALARWGRPPLALAVVLALGSAWITEAIGVHAIFGAFLAGVVWPRTDRVHLESRLELLVEAALLPVFFVVVGLSTEIALVDSPARWAILFAVLAVAIVGKLGGVAVAASLMGESRRDALTIGILMNTRGLTEIVILTVGLEEGILGPTMFTIMVLMALVTTYMAVPALKLLGVGSPAAGAMRS